MSKHLARVSTREPAITATTTAAAVTTVVSIAAVIGLNLTTEQATALLVVLGLVSHLVAGFVTRSKVIPAAAVVDADDPGA